MSLIYEEVERIFIQFYDYVEREQQVIEPVLEKYNTIQTDSQALFNRMGTTLS
ncbi:MAG: hypothetical protein HC881_05390 [Leptolyngbyaceae cyanobacterium SL_7_1]|nr:hypothetical protein [Leptolyngbyaceae cyanobacterium SL_7_1]